MNKQLLQAYINQIRKYPLLTAEQEEALADKASNGDKKAFDTLINSNLRLVISVAKKYHNQEKNSKLLRTVFSENKEVKEWMIYKGKSLKY